MKRETVVNNLRNEYKKILKERKTNPCYKRAYINLPINLLERTFLEVYSKSYGMTQTQTIRDFIHELMKKYPKLVDVAKKRIKEEQRNK